MYFIFQDPEDLSKIYKTRSYGRAHKSVMLGYKYLGSIEHCMGIQFNFCESLPKETRCIPNEYKHQKNLTGILKTINNSKWRPGTHYEMRQEGRQYIKSN